MFQEHYFHAKDGLKLYGRSYSVDNWRSHANTPVICLPGLTRNSRDFHPLAVFLASAAGGARPVIALDYRGRGQSQRDDDKSRYTIAVEADDVITACRYFGVQKAIFIGTSRGGLILHHLIGSAPALIAGAILNDIGPVVEIGGLVRIRDYLNAATAPDSWAAAPHYLQAIHGEDFPILRHEDWEDMAKAIYRDEGGVPITDFDPAIASQLQALNADAVLSSLWPQFDAFAGLPMMVIRGQYSSLLSQTTVEEMVRRHPGLVTTTATGQGHAPLLHLDGLRHEIAAFIRG